MNPRELRELTQIIEQNGLLQPILVRPVDGGFEIVSGHRRFEAMRLLTEANPEDPRFETITAIVGDVDEDLVPILQLAENLNRSPLSHLETAAGFARMIAKGRTVVHRRRSVLRRRGNLESRRPSRRKATSPSPIPSQGPRR